MYLDYQLIRTLLVQAMFNDESSRAAAILFAEIEYVDSETALESLKEWIEIWYEDNQVAMSLLQYVHRQIAKQR